MLCCRNRFGSERITFEPLVLVCDFIQFYIRDRATEFAPFSSIACPFLWRWPCDLEDAPLKGQERLFCFFSCVHLIYIYVVSWICHHVFLWCLNLYSSLRVLFGSILVVLLSCMAFRVWCVIHDCYTRSELPAFNLNYP